jgi:hypothetical protein
MAAFNNRILFIMEIEFQKKVRAGFLDTHLQRIQGSNHSPTHILHT